MKIIKLQAATEAARRVPMRLVDSVTGADKTGLSFASGEMRIHKNGAAGYVNANGSVVEIGAGDYDYIPTQEEINTLGTLRVKPFKTGVAASVFVAQIVAYDPNDANAMGMARLDMMVSSVSGGGGGGDNSGTVALLERLTPARAANLDKLDVSTSSLSTKIDTVLARLPAALLDGKMSVAFDPAERQNLATALLDLSNGVEIGLTVRQALRATAAILFGNSTDTGTNSEKFMAAKSAAQVRVTSALDVNNNRTVTLDAG